MDLQGVEDMSAISARTSEKPFCYRFVKRLFDIAFSAVVILVLLVPSLILSIFIVLDTRSSPVYSSVRVGHKGPFKFYKFRTMIADGDNLEKHLSPEQLDEWNREHKVKDDPRITRLGRCLRRTSLDELPQFLHVFAGQMSTIGPRVVTEEELDHLGKERDLYLSVPGGITGLWQVTARNTASWENGSRQAIELDYARNASLWLDIKIFFYTFKAMFVKRSGR